ncbi:unnamed protein product [Didymodactylos carnosus]|uniref:Transporter n=1 Tax=Didymodactylos carnosus TaxID=1234261 RepID=A0A813QYM2_9BILA|nr:unnamed protein product [Didymodactylos carnosus]CAF3557484.1 unnamed protein product [Didymodactylos carnosus]
MAVGLGNVWRFPYLCFKNGGSAFLIPYTFMMIFIGAPVFYLELSLGQFTSAGPISVWRVNPLLKGDHARVGFASITTNMMLGLYYNVLIAYCFYYLVSSFTILVPWATCGNWWNTPLCTDQQALANMTLYNVSKSKDMTSSPSEEYFYRRVLQISSGIEFTEGIVPHLAIALAAAWFICFISLSKGVQTLGKIAYFTALFPYVMLTVLIIRGATLSGANEGIKFYLGTLKLSVLKNPNVCFVIKLLHFSLTNDFKPQGHMATKMGVSVADVAKGGPGLAFVVFPEGLSMMPVAPLWCILFFLMMCTLGFGSEFSIMETVMSCIIDEFKPYLNTPRKVIIFRFVTCTVFCLLGLSMVTKGGLYFLNIIDQYLGGFPWLCIGVVELLIIAWIYGVDNFCDDIAIMLGEERRPGKFWKICWKWLTILFSSLFYQQVTLDEYKYPEWAHALGWLVVIICLFPIPFFFILEICRRGTWTIIKERSQPHKKWGPLKPEHRELSSRYSSTNLAQSNGDLSKKTISFQTISTMFDETNVGFYMDDDTKGETNKNLFLKRLSEVSSTRF